MGTGYFMKFLKSADLADTIQGLILSEAGGLKNWLRISGNYLSVCKMGKNLDTEDFIFDFHKTNKKAK